MKGKRVCSFLAGLMNLLYALILTGGIVLGLYAGFAAMFEINSAGSDLAGALAALAGSLVMVVVFVAILIMLVPCILMWISSIGLIKRAVKGKRPLAFAVLSIIVHVLLSLGFSIGLIVCIAGEADILGILLIGAALLWSVVNIVLCGISVTGWAKNQLTVYNQYFNNNVIDD